MRIPIQYALTYPQRFSTPTQQLDLLSLQALHFEKPDVERFPALQLAYEAGRTGGTMPAVLNAANEVAVEHFLTGKIKFTNIPDIVSHVMSCHQAQVVRTVNDVLQWDHNARELAKERIAKGG